MIRSRCPPIPHTVFSSAVFLLALLGAARAGEGTSLDPPVHTVLGPVRADRLGAVLVHEHVLVDFIGADRIGPGRYNPEEAFQVALPFLKALKERGCGALVECTPEFLGRDPILLRRLSKATGLHILTNTGWYGAAGDKFVPRIAREETADRLCERWTAEFRDGIGTSGIRPGFIKIGVDGGLLSEIDRKLVTAAARTHRKTGLVIAVHTGDGTAARDIIRTIEGEKVSPAAFIWVHAQNEKDRSLHEEAAAKGVWLGFDGIGEKSLDADVDTVVFFARKGLLGSLLLSQDAGWYNVGEPKGGTFRPYTFFFDVFLPALRQKGITEAQIRTLTVDNPARAFSIRMERP